VVRKDQDMADMGDLRGKVLALAKRTKQHCRLFLERRCLAGGEQAQRFFAQVTKPASVEEALDDVVNGEVQATVVDSGSLEWYRERKPGCYARLKTLQESEPFPAGVVAYRPGALDEAVAHRFRDGMISAHQSERARNLLKLCQITGFAAVPDDYDKLLADIAKLYPPPERAGQEAGAKKSEKQLAVGK